MMWIQCHQCHLLVPMWLPERFRKLMLQAAKTLENIYTLGRKVTIDNFCRIFHYKCIQNILYLNNRLFKQGKAENNKCSFCNNFTEDIIHLFSQCSKTKSLWISLKNRINLQLSELTPESAYLGFHDLDDILFNHIHLIFKIAVYTRRADKNCSIEYILDKIFQIKEIEENLSFFRKPSHGARGSC